jgi:pyridoxamine 5'-phosphate oxidase
MQRLLIVGLPLPKIPMPSLSDIRKNYSAQTLSEDSVDTDPIRQFETWWSQAVDAGIDEVNAMTLATSSADGLPSARIVLLKEFSAEGFVFFTNYNSYKGRHLEENPRACLVFFWKELERQVRITGIVEKVSEKDSDIYFHSRPPGSQVGAVVSPQSMVIESREWLDKKYEEIEPALNGKELPRPAHWGGYIVKPIVVEFWQGRPSRLHDRLEYSLQESGDWKMQRLAP